MNRLIRWGAAAALAFAAQQGSAQAPQGSAAGAPNDPAAAQTMQQVHAINLQLIDAGQLAQQRGSSQNVKDFGKRIVDEHQGLENQLTQMAQRRGIQLQPKDQVLAQPAHAGAMNNLRKLSGPQFDQAAMDLFVTERTARVDELKHLRDQIPGRDAELKKWLSDMEVAMEHTRNEARNVRQAVRETAQQQRQGRKP